MNLCMSRLGWKPWLLSFFALAAVACDGDDDGSSDDDTDRSTLDPRGGFSLSVTPVAPGLPNLGGRTCPAQGTVTLGSPPPTSTTPGGLVRGDYAAGTGVLCVIAKEGETYRLDVTVAAFMDTPEEKGLASLANTVDPRVGDPLVGVQMGAPIIGDLTTVDTNPCSIGAVHEISPGNVWTDFDCPMLVGPDEATACAVHGTYEFRGCLTGDEF